MESPARRWVDVTHVRVRLGCPDCGKSSDVPVHKVRLYRCTTKSDADFYAWVCPACEQPVSRRADVSSTCLLIGAGVPTSLYEWPQEAADKVRRAAAWQPYETDDLLLDLAALETAEGWDAA